jgi:hypothetical protein
MRSGVLPGEVMEYIIRECILEHIEGCESHVVIPEGVTGIGKAAFLNCEILESVTLPNSLQSIGELAFDGCRNLSWIRLPKGLKKIGRNAFYECSSLTEIILPEGLEGIEENTFAECRKLLRVALPKSMRYISGRAFDGCVSLAKISLPDDLRKIGYHAFARCSRMVEIILPERITSVEEYTFDGCKGLRHIHLPENVAKIGNGAFRGCEQLTEIRLPDNLFYVGADAFCGCTRLRYIQGGERADILYSRQYFDDATADSLLTYNHVPVNRIMDRQWKRMAAVRHAQCWLAGEEMPEEICEGYLEYLRDHRKEFYADILENTTLLEYMCRREIIPQAETPNLIDAAIKAQKTEVSARLLEYQNQGQKEERDAFEMELEAFLL